MSDKENNHWSNSEGSDVGEKRYIGYDEEREKFQNFFQNRQPYQFEQEKQ